MQHTKARLLAKWGQIADRKWPAIQELVCNEVTACSLHAGSPFKFAAIVVGEPDLSVGNAICWKREERMTFGWKITWLIGLQNEGAEAGIGMRFLFVVEEDRNCVLHVELCLRFCSKIGQILLISLFIKMKAAGAKEAPGQRFPHRKWNKFKNNLP